MQAHPRREKLITDYVLMRTRVLQRVAVLPHLAHVKRVS